MRKLLISSSLALAMGLTGLPLLSYAASAQDLELNLGDNGGPKLRMREACDPNVQDCYARDRYMDRGEGRGCTEDRALDKAERMGIRHVRIEDAGRRTIDVRGRDRDGERVMLTFARAPGCPLLN
jgi:hypothetical protein